jgi:hypothetical protein
MSARKRIKVNDISQLLFCDSESNGVIIVDADNDKGDGCKDSIINDNVENEKITGLKYEMCNWKSK